MNNNRTSRDMKNIDNKLLKMYEASAELSLKELGKRLGIFSASAVSKRLNNLKRNGYISGISARLDYSKLGFGFMTVTFVRAKFGKNYNHIIGEKLLKLPGVITLYFLLGDIDFVMVTLNKSKEEYEETLDMLTDIEGIERTDTRVVLQKLRDFDFRNVELP